MNNRNLVTWVICLHLLAWHAGPAVAADRLIITNGKLFTATNGQLVDGVNLVIRGDRIESITNDPVDPLDAKVIDARGYTVMPGLIDTHVHLFFDLQSGVRFPTSDSEADAFIEQELPDDLEAYLQHGFTTLLAAIDFWPHIMDVRERLASGVLAGPRLLVAGGVLMAPGWHYICRGLEGEPKSWCNQHVAVEIGNAGEGRAAVKRYAASGVDLIVYDSLTNADGVDPETVRAIVEAAHAEGLRVLVHNSDARGFRSLIAAGVDGFLHPPSGIFDPERGEWSLIAQDAVPAGLMLGITIGETEEAIRAGERTEQQRAAYEITRKNVQRMLDQGAMPVFASDMPGASPDRTRAIVFRSLTDLGLSNAEVLLTATRDAARALRRESEIGTLEPGKLADILIVRGDPLDDLEAVSQVELVIKGGEIVVDNRGNRAP